jgi:hypothetical protein
MAVLAHYELPRTGQFRFGESPGLERRFVCTVDDPGTTGMRDCVNAVGVDYGVPHPEFTAVPCTSLEINEAYDESRYHIELIARYEITDEILDNINPLLRPDVWKFETQGASVPALFYFDPQSNTVQYPLTNSAFDFFEGLTVDEAQTRVVIEANRPEFPSAIATALTNTINSAPWIGGGVGFWKCQGITGELRRELVGTQIIRYWKITSTLMYRQTGWNLLLPDMGFNTLVGGQKRRVMTFDFENSEWIPSPVPMGLNGSGAQTFGAPAILNRRVYRMVDFNVYFGNPPA